ncbi:hypothetical protein MUK42_32585 [Musa troglodytarum]|uniref:DUF7803 domain-containing protein n=1 Tax=Musa troglodytarum TaxID=320322 RepID=A0A9E7L1W9_9LILI|nr:hypothetical protein MUK42_32585 [Musa troglodytarum]
MTLTLRSPSSYNIVFDGGRDDGLAPKPSFSSRLLAVGAPFQHHPAYLHYQRRDTYQLSNHGWHQMGRFVIEHCYYRLNPIMEEIISLGDDLMLGLPSPIIPPEIASHVLEVSDLYFGNKRESHLVNALGLQINNIEPFCQDEIVLYQQCAEKRLRQRLLDSEHKLGLAMPFTAAKERATDLQSEVTSLERHMIIASGIEIMEGFHQRWSLHGCLEDTKRRLEALNRGIAKTKPGNIQGEAKGDAGRGMTLGLYGCHSMILEQSAGMPFNLVSSSRITFWTNIIESCRNISMV